MTQTAIPMDEIYQRLGVSADTIAQFCEKWQLVELSLFGSVLRHDFRPQGNDPSDVDLLYVNDPQARYGFKFFDMREELEQLLQRKVDLISKRGIQNSRNHLRRREILDSAKIIYEKE